jgi:hypothetical protein
MIQDIHEMHLCYIFVTVIPNQIKQKNDTAHLEFVLMKFCYYISVMWQISRQYCAQPNVFRCCGFMISLALVILCCTRTFQHYLHVQQFHKLPYLSYQKMFKGHYI